MGRISNQTEMPCGPIPFSNIFAMLAMNFSKIYKLILIDNFQKFLLNYAWEFIATVWDLWKIQMLQSQLCDLSIQTNLSKACPYLLSDTSNERFLYNFL